MNVSAHALSPTKLVVTWSPPLHTNGVITQYQVTYATAYESTMVYRYMLYMLPELGPNTTFTIQVYSKVTSSQNIVLMNLTPTEYRLKVSTSHDGCSFIHVHVQGYNVLGLIMYRGVCRIFAD